MWCLQMFCGITTQFQHNVDDAASAPTEAVFEMILLKETFRPI
jgi:hypothetical protein